MCVFVWVFSSDKTWQKFWIQFLLVKHSKFRPLLQKNQIQVKYSIHTRSARFASAASCVVKLNKHSCLFTSLLKVYLNFSSKVLVKVKVCKCFNTYYSTILKYWGEGCLCFSLEILMAGLDSFKSCCFTSWIISNYIDKNVPGVTYHMLSHRILSFHFLTGRKFWFLIADATPQPAST